MVTNLLRRLANSIGKRRARFYRIGSLKEFRRLIVQVANEKGEFRPWYISFKGSINGIHVVILDTEFYRIRFSHERLDIICRVGFLSAPNIVSDFASDEQVWYSANFLRDYINDRADISRKEILHIDTRSNEIILYEAIEIINSYHGRFANLLSPENYNETERSLSEFIKRRKTAMTKALGSDRSLAER